jgi:hypothetical protein
MIVNMYLSYSLYRANETNELMFSGLTMIAKAAKTGKAEAFKSGCMSAVVSALHLDTEDPLYEQWCSMMGAKYSVAK